MLTCGNHRLAAELPSAVKAAGFEGVESTALRWPIGGGPDTKDLGPNYIKESIPSVMVFSNILLHLAVKFGGFEGCTTDDEADKALKECANELSENGCHLDIVVVVARKPL